METLIKYTLIQTIIIIAIIPVIGIVLDKLNNIMVRVIANSIGTRFAYFFANRLTFIGVIHHELSHALFAFLSGAKIIRIELFKPSGNRLGQVEFVPRGNMVLKSIQLAITAVAPIVTGIISTYLLIYKVIANVNIIYIKIILYYTVISIILHMTMSKKDIKSMFKGLPVVIVLVFTITSILNIFLI